MHISHFKITPKNFKKNDHEVSTLYNEDVRFQCYCSSEADVCELVVYKLPMHCLDIGNTGNILFVAERKLYTYYKAGLMVQNPSSASKSTRFLKFKLDEISRNVPSLCLLIQ